MSHHFPLRAFPSTSTSVRAMAEQAFSRAAGAQLVEGNSIRLLKDATQNYPAWIDAIASASLWVHFENYFITDDAAGRMFAEVMADKARQGVKVRLVYDWMGSFGRASGRFWDTLRKAGVDVRCFNPPRLDEPFGWVVRNHRKSLSVDGRIGFVSGLCIGSAWQGDPSRAIEPWRDTGVAITGPAVADIDQAFADVWATMGPPLPDEEIHDPASIHPTGEVTLQVIATAPYTTGLYRLDQLVAALARSTLWLTDAYFLGLPPYVQALKAAAMDGVDVRLLVPGTTDIPVVRALSRAGYQTLLEAGVRVFEWNGPMLHAKTAVADGRWARIGSSNLNVSSWVGNYELDVAVENEAFAQAMERMYVEDLSRSTEVVLSGDRKVCLAGRRPTRRRLGGAGIRGRRRGSLGKAGVGVMRLGNVVESAITGRRALGSVETTITLASGVVLLALAAAVLVWPKLLAVPFAVVCLWLSWALFLRAWRLGRRRARLDDALSGKSPGEQCLSPRDHAPREGDAGPLARE